MAEDQKLNELVEIALEAMGIDIGRTLENAGLSVEFSSQATAKANGLILIY
jgi:predicted metal-binding protein